MVARTPGSAGGRTPRQARGVETVERAVATTVELLDEVGPSEVRFALVTERAGISNGSLLHHFGSLGGLLSAAEAVRYETAVSTRLAAARKLVLASGDVAALQAVVPNTVGVDFVAEAPVAAVVVAASEPELLAFEPAVLEGVIPVLVDDGPVEILFCVRSVSEVPDDPDGSGDEGAPVDPGDQDAVTFGTLDDPTTIPTGGGPSGRTTLALVALVLLALGGSTGLLVWSRGG